MRYVADPAERDFAHITIRGPYKQRYNLCNLNKMVQGAEVMADGVGSFLSKKQNTVFIRCRSQILRNVWMKPDYGFNPHITIYDGPSREFADRVLGVLGDMSLRFRFVVGDLAPLVSHGQQYAMDLGQSLNRELLGTWSGMKLGLEDSWRLSVEQRCSLIEALGREVERYCSTSGIGGGEGPEWSHSGLQGTSHMGT